MTENVLELKKRTVDREVLRAAQDVLTRAMNGEIRGFVLVADCGDHYLRSIAGKSAQGKYSLIGQIRMMEHEVVTNIESSSQFEKFKE